MLPVSLARLLCLEGDLDHQTATLFDYIRMREERLQDLSRAASDVERLLRPRWTGCKVLQFGSTVTGLTLKSSDIDIYVHTPHSVEDPVLLASYAYDIVRNYPNLFQRCDMKLVMGRIPRVTCVHVPRDVFIDVVFTDPIAVESSRVISYLLHLDPRALDLATIIKYWSFVHGVSVGRSTLPSYSMMLMVIFYLQQKGILPPIAALQEGVTPFEVDNWNAVLHPIEFHTQNNETLYELLGGFFKYYSDFDFKNTVISPYVGYLVKRSHFEDLDKLENFHFYKRNTLNGYTRPMRLGYINVQDALNHGENTARRLHDPWLVIRLVRHMRIAARIFEVTCSEQFLTALLVPEKIEAGVQKTNQEGIGSPEECKFQEKIK